MGTRFPTSAAEPLRYRLVTVSPERFVGEPCLVRVTVFADNA